MYTVTFQDAQGTEQISRFFSTIKAARTWAAWLRTRDFAREVFLYRGQAGSELVEGRAR